jgi:hypothetical protein
MYIYIKVYFLDTSWNEFLTVNSNLKSTKRRVKITYFILKGSDDGVMRFEKSYFRTLSIVQYFSLKTKFRKLALLPSSVSVQWLRLALSRGSHRVGVTPSPHILPEDGSRASFRNVVFKEKHSTMDKVLKEDSSKSRNLFAQILTNPKEHSPFWKGNGRLSVQEIHRLYLPGG